MYQTVNFNIFHAAFKAIRPDSFSYEGLKALFEYLEQYEEDSGVPIKLHVIELCCEFSEMTDSEFREQYEGEPLEHDRVVCALDNGNFLVR